MLHPIYHAASRAAQAGLPLKSMAWVWRWVIAESHKTKTTKQTKNLMPFTKYKLGFITVRVWRDSEDPRTKKREGGEGHLHKSKTSHNCKTNWLQIYPDLQHSWTPNPQLSLPKYTQRPAHKEENGSEASSCLSRSAQMHTVVSMYLNRHIPKNKRQTERGRQTWAHPFPLVWNTNNLGV